METLNFFWPNYFIFGVTSEESNFLVRQSIDQGRVYQKVNVMEFILSTLIALLNLVPMASNSDVQVKNPGCDPSVYPCITFSPDIK